MFVVGNRRCGKTCRSHLQGRNSNRRWNWNSVWKRL